GIATTNDAAGAGWVQLFPAFGLTRAGEYLCTATVNIIATGPAATVATIGVAAATAAQPTVTSAGYIPASTYGAVAPATAVLAVAAGDNLRVFVHGGVGSATFGTRTLTIVPRRVA